MLGLRRNLNSQAANNAPKATAEPAKTVADAASANLARLKHMARQHCQSFGLRPSEG